MTFPRLPFDEVFSDESGGNIKTPQSEYLATGSYPVVDQGKELIAGYVEESERICGSGKSAIVFGDHTRCVKYVDFPFCMGADGVKVLRAKVDADLKYLYYYLNSLDIPNAGYSRHFKYLKRTEIVLPPLPEQRRIAAILDQADALRAKRREALAQLDSLTQSIFIEMFGDPTSNPKGLPFKPLTEVCHCYSGGTPSKANESLWQGQLPWFTPKDLKQSDLHDSIDHISSEIPSMSTLKLLPPGTVAIVVRGMILAHTFPISVLRIPATINQDLKALLPYETMDSQFLAYCLRAQEKFILGQVSEAGHGTKRLDAEALSKIKIPTVSLDRQNEFSVRVYAVEKLKATFSESMTELDCLFASLQHRAFRGEL